MGFASPKMCLERPYAGEDTTYVQTSKLTTTYDLSLYFFGCLESRHFERHHDKISVSMKPYIVLYAWEQSESIHDTENLDNILNL